MTKEAIKRYKYLLKNRQKRIALYFWFKKGFVGRVLNNFIDIRTSGLENIPEGPCIIVSHHCLYFDSAVIGYSLPRKTHGWIDEDAFSKPGLKLLCALLEQIPVKTGGQASREDYKKTKELSLLWLRNTNEIVGLTNDGASKYLFDENGKIMDIYSRPNHSGAASLAMDANVPVIPAAARIHEKHQKKLFVSHGFKSIIYMGKNRRIPYLLSFCKPIKPADYKNKKDLKEAIRKSQLESYEKLLKIQI